MCCYNIDLCDKYCIQLYSSILMNYNAPSESNVSNDEINPKTPSHFPLPSPPMCIILITDKFGMYIRFITASLSSLRVTVVDCVCIIGDFS